MTNGTLYYYKVSAKASSIEGSPSAAVAVTPSGGTAPTTAIALTGTLGADGWYISPVSVSITATDPDGDWLKSFYKLDDAAGWSNYSSDLSVSANGAHSVAAYSEDQAGNVEAAQANSAFKIDTTAPSVTGAVAFAAECERLVCNRRAGKLLGP